MAQLLAFGGNNGRKDLDVLDAVDLEAISLARTWGVTNGHKDGAWTFSRCLRDDCGGSVVLGWGGCMLCGRNG